MKKYFFDLVSAQRSEFDFRVGEFPSPEHALQLAELIAFDLSTEAEGKWLGWTIEVRNTQNRQLFSIPVSGGAT
jgi:hypothetical protein